MAAIWQAPALAFCPAPVGAKTVAVRQVIDGDTLRLADGRSVRLIGLNAPEIGRKGKRSEALAETARRRLATLVRENGGRVGLVAGRESRDKYGRTLAHVYGRSGDNLPARLLSEGLGYRLAVAPNNRLAACQQLAEQAARKAGLGLWRHARVPAARELRRPGFAVVGGRVSDVRGYRGGIRLEIDDTLVVRVPAALRRTLPADLKGRRVEVRGWVLDRSRNNGSSAQRKRWLLVLGDASMLERLES